VGVFCGADCADIDNDFWVAAATKARLASFV